MPGTDERALVFRFNEYGQGPDMLRQVFMERGWLEFDEDEQEDWDWNLWWRSSRFRTSDYDNLHAWQRLNHYPKATAITRKDNLARHLKRMKAVYGPHIYNFSPTGYNLPNDYTRFVADYTQKKEKAPDKCQYWICKPADLSRGRGIFIFKELSELQYDCSAVVQQYIINPMLIAGYKFDLRIYVMVPSFQPLKIYVYEEGLVRFSTEKYDLEKTGNAFAHLTNTSINKHSPTYALDKERVGPGCKWTLTQLRQYFRQSNINDVKLWGRIINIIILSLIIQASQLDKVADCFELYGFDVLIDQNAKPWLLEVNFSPALSSDCQTDLIVKKPMLHDMIELLNFQENDKIRELSYVNHRDVFRHPYTYGASSPKPGLRSPARRTTRNGAQWKTARSKAQEKSPPSASEKGEDDVDSDGSSTCESVSIIPGCGLPSVQQFHSTVQLGNSREGSNSSASGRTSVERKAEFRNVTGVPPKSQLKRTMSVSSGTLSTIERRDSTNTMVASPGKASYKVGYRDISRTKDSMLSYTRLAESRKRMPNFSAGSDSGKPATKNHNYDAEIQDQSHGQFEPKVTDSFNHAVSPTRLVGDSLKPTKSVASDTRQKLPSITFQNATKRVIQNKKMSILASALSAGIESSSGQDSIISSQSLTQPKTAQPKPNLLGAPESVGDFVLTFPFNVKTKNCSGRNLDTKLAIRECQRMLKTRTERIQSCKDNSPNALHGRLLWGPLKEDPKVKG